VKCSADRLIEALIGAQILEMQRQQVTHIEDHRPLVVTVSRSFGAQGKELAQALAERLCVRCCDRYILQEVARRANVDEELVEALDGHTGREQSHWWQHLLDKNSFTNEDYYHHLVSVMVSIAQNGGVILGRGGNMILGPERAFRIRITGSLEDCASRVADREGLSMDDAAERIQFVDKERAAYIRELYEVDINEGSEYDLMINSDRYQPEQMVEIITHAMQASGYHIPDRCPAEEHGT
jgi:cytidylate kinase